MSHPTQNVRHKLVLAMVLAVASVAGTEFDVALVADVAAVTRDELVGAIDEARVARMVVDSLVEHGEALPSEPSDQVQILAEPQVAVIV